MSASITFCPFLFIWRGLYFISLLKDSYAEYSNLGWQFLNLWALWICLPTTFLLRSELLYYWSSLVSDESIVFLLLSRFSPYHQLKAFLLWCACFLISVLILLASWSLWMCIWISFLVNMGTLQLFVLIFSALLIHISLLGTVIMHFWCIQ